MTDQSHTTCLSNLATSFSHPHVRFLRDQLNHLRNGQPALALEKIVHCIPCTPGVGAGRYEETNGNIYLCQNNLNSAKHTTKTLSHEMIHLYDHLSTDIDWRNIDQHACSEIRAANLSKECSFMSQMKHLIGAGGFAGGYEKCIRRRARLALSARSDQPSQELVDRTVDKMFKMCYEDTTPFDEIP